MTSVPDGTPTHPLSSRGRRARVLLVLVGLVVLWDIDPEHVESLGIWLGVLTVLAPEVLARRGDEPPGGLRTAR